MHIEPKTQTIEESLSGLTTRFSVPSYQRDYSRTPHHPFQQPRLD